MKNIKLTFTFGVILFLLTNCSDKEKKEETKIVNKCKERFALSVAQKIVFAEKTYRLKKEVDEFFKMYHDENIDCDTFKEFYESKIEKAISVIHEKTEDSLNNLKNYENKKYLDSISKLLDSINKQNEKKLNEILKEIDGVKLK